MGDKEEKSWENTAVEVDQLPAAFRQWLCDNDVDPEVYTRAHKLHRYIRVSSRADVGLEALTTAFGTELRRVDWLHGFYQLPSCAKVAGAELYTQGLVYGMDASSGAAVEALQVSAGQHCLDICCAPGMKLAVMAELAGVHGSVTGVDIAEQRINVCKNVVSKYKLENVRLFWADGTNFDIKAPLPIPPELQNQVIAPKTPES